MENKSTFTGVNRCEVKIDDSCDKISSLDDLPVTVTRNSLRQFILEILKEKGLLKEDNQ